ncbi:Hypothetical protein SMAX5B_019767 [Scophthalmus maximus]|uniref:Uncharacterized protein n=1 Tax=Scophthalmus maximus TaxID=52904 RepID=A0A2U9BQ42_SCOMX|nr:Hypothetical protein SMAX5B_019767 [Scophthalmus maximus]
MNIVKPAEETGGRKDSSKLNITEVTVGGREAPSDQLSVQRGRPNKARTFSTTLSLSFIIYRGSVPCQRRSPLEQGRSLSGGQWTVEPEMAVDSL